MDNSSSSAIEQTFLYDKRERLLHAGAECHVVDRRLSAQPHKANQYYVHKANSDRRLDQWIDEDQLQRPPKAQRGASGQPHRRMLESLDVAQAEAVGSEAAASAAAGELDAVTLKEHEAATRVKNINAIVLGAWRMETWYYSPFPREFEGSDVLYFCEFDLHFTRSQRSLTRHLSRPELLPHPPGVEVYRADGLSVFEVDGAHAPRFCQNLCLLAKLFLDHKALYWGVEPFLFYVLCECDEAGCHPVGYFSKEKASPDDYNLACILTLPPFQRKGYGRFLISLSYELSRRDGKMGTPERPLSDLGLVSYRSFWAAGILSELQATARSSRPTISIISISRRTGFRTDDIVNTLQALGLVKYFKGQHLIVVSPKVLRENELADEAQELKLSFDPTKLQYKPIASRKSWR